MGAMQAVDTFTKPTIAAVHGHALGGGCELTIVCDIVVADETAKFGTPEATVGPHSRTGRRARCRAREPALAQVHGLHGRVPRRAEAQLAGLVNRVTPAGEHLAAAEELAAQDRPACAAGARRRQADPQPQRFEEAYRHAIDAVGLPAGHRGLRRRHRGIQRTAPATIRGTVKVATEEPPRSPIRPIRTRSSHAGATRRWAAAGRTAWPRSTPRAARRRASASSS